MKKLIPLAAIIVLLGVLLYSQQAHKMNQDIVFGYYQEMLPEAAVYNPLSDNVAEAKAADGSIIAYLGVKSAVGYGGPIMVATIINLDGTMLEPVIIDHKETPSYLDKLERAGYFSQYSKKRADDALILKYDIDNVSGATLSSRAIALCVNDVAHIVATRALDTTPKKAVLPWEVGIKEISIALLFVVGLFLSRVKKLAKYRVHFLIVSVAVLGFWLNRSLAIAQVQAAFMGFFPALAQNMIWYIVMIGALAPALLIGKNIYCTYLCPFCGLQEVTHLISRVNLPIGKYLKYVRLLKNVILFTVLFLGFLTLNPSLASVEPFGTIFGLNGSSFNWYLLFVVLVASFFFRRFWCYAFCPVGTFLDLLASWRRAFARRFFSRTGTANPANIDRKVKAGVPAVKGKVGESAAKAGIAFWALYATVLLLIVLTIWEGFSGI